ncbi:MAG: ABC transporter ATP-binding protein [Candidatus Kapaibacterium sp.]
MSIIVNLDNISFSYSKKNSLIEDFSLKIESEKIYCLLGENGVGKSTLLKLISGVESPIKGSVLIEGMDYENDYFAIKENLLAFINEPSFYSHLSASDNLRILCKYRNLPEHGIEEALDFAELRDHKTKFGKFSSGMKQRILLAIIYLVDSKLLLLDEPFSNLDPKIAIKFREFLIRLKNENKSTIILSSHNIREMSTISDYFVFINNGKLIEVVENTGDIDDIEKRILAMYL